VYGSIFIALAVCFTRYINVSIALTDLLACSKSALSAIFTRINDLNCTASDTNLLLCACDINPSKSDAPNGGAVAAYFFEVKNCNE
tara:strand:- start:44 stop:301 length:258 start_codon:yes stop_codon:yes gene_type:complete